MIGFRRRRAARSPSRHLSSYLVPYINTRFSVDQRNKRNSRCGQQFRFGTLRSKGGKLMDDKGHELVDQLPRETVDRYQEQKQKGCELVEAMFRQTLDR